MTLIASSTNFIWNNKPVKKLQLKGSNGATGVISFERGFVRKGAENMSQAQITAFDAVADICKKAALLEAKQPQNLLIILENAGWEVYPD